MTVTILQGAALTVLESLPERSVQTCVTSPPYWCLRDYGVEGQLGLEATPEEYTSKLVAILRQVRRVLRDDGTLWLNLGDSYTSSGRGGIGERSTLEGGHESQNQSRAELVARPSARRDKAPVVASAHVAVPGLRPKNLVGIPWRVAFALQADGWNLRADLIWNKPNPMPESVTDRPTKAHEYVFLFSKSEAYFYDGEAIAESATGKPPGNVSHRGLQAYEAGDEHHRTKGGLVDIGARVTRNSRSVWTITTTPMPEAHFATFPEALPKRCILAGTSERGCCPTCGRPVERMVAREQPPRQGPVVPSERDGGLTREQGAERTGMTHRQRNEWLKTHPPRTVGWAACEAHRAAAGRQAPCVVLDPFAGSGTTGRVAESLGRDAILVELNPEYVEIIRGRTQQTGLALTGVGDGR